MAHEGLRRLHISSSFSTFHQCFELIPLSKARCAPVLAKFLQNAVLIFASEKSFDGCK
jgi:hypothetical protein